MIIANNMAASNTNRQLGITNNSKNKWLERLSSGYRINRAADDAAGLAISEKMRAQIRGLNRGAQNVEEGINFCNVADAALTEVHDMLDRIKELSVQAANDTNVTADRIAINEEINLIKKEINRVSRETEYNTYKIFNKSLTEDFSDGISVIQIFDANNGDPMDPASYGGIIFNGSTRVPWTDIDPNMIQTDPVTGKIQFTPGTYTYDVGGYELLIECREESKPPQITVTFPVHADTNGLFVAGTCIAWSEIVNEDGEPLLEHIGEDGFYCFPFGDGEGGFYVEDSDTLDDIINGINASNVDFARKYINEYDVYYKAQAVDMIDNGSKMHVNNSIRNVIINKGSLDAKLSANATGVSVIDAAGNMVAGSTKTWADMGITNWNSGSDISDQKIYQYKFQNGVYDIQFNYTLLDETSLESVIDGINQAVLRESGTTVKNKTEIVFTADGGLTNGTITKLANDLSLYEEAVLGRDFDVQTDIIAEEKMVYDPAKDRFTLTYINVNGDPELEYVSRNLTSADFFAEKGTTYQDYLIAKSIQSQFSNARTPAPDSLEALLGSDKVNTDGYMSDVITINTTDIYETDSMGNVVTDSNGNPVVLKPAMKITNPTNSGYKLQDGKTYPGTITDFSGLGTEYQLSDLLGLGFNSTCKTCNNHYSVMFTYGGAKNIDTNGYGYTKIRDGQNNYTLKIDLNTFMNKGITDGTQFASALVDIMSSSGFDFHFTQYVADGAKLYVCDDRAQNSPTMAATFDTNPYEVENFTFTMTLDEKDSSRSIDLKYVYNLKDFFKPYAEPVKDNQNGNLVKDGTGYKSYNPNDPNMVGLDRYRFELMDTVSDWNTYYDQIMEKVAAQSKIQLQAEDYATIKYLADERANSATVSKFNFLVEDNRNFWIQAGANSGQGVAMTWESFSTYKLGMAFANVLDQESAEKFNEIADDAIESISEIRTTFGVYTNRLGHMYAMDTNTSENLQSAESKIRDMDLAEAMAAFARANILEQAGQSMLAQANRITEGVVRLLQ